MTREEIYENAKAYIDQKPNLLLELPTGFGKSKLSIDLINYVHRRNPSKEISVLILVAKRVHKQTWVDEIKKWGGIENAVITIECYESMHKYRGGQFDFLLMDEVHHVKSEARLDHLRNIGFTHMIGLSATIPKKLKYHLISSFKTNVVSCDIVEAIESNVLPEPKILLLPLMLDTTTYSETWEMNPKAKGEPIKIDFSLIWNYRKCKQRVLVRCTQRQYLNELNSLISWEKKRYLATRNPGVERRWLFHCGQRLEYLSNCKMPMVERILGSLKSDKNNRTITFCKSIEQCEKLGEHCIHSRNPDADEVYNAFNRQEINHITAVNILNENANLVNCKYAIFCNLSSSEIVSFQRLGKL